MKRAWIFVQVLSLLALSACTGKEETSNNAMMDVDGGDEDGRYAGIGTYPSDGLWNDIEGAEATNDAQAARQGDDSQVIVVVDRRTGEVRQCGNRSGFCIAINPWKAGGRAAPPQLPVRIDRHLPVQAGNEAVRAADVVQTQPIKPTNKK